MAGFITTFFGPLGKDSCVYFMFFTILFFISLIIALFAHIILLVKNFRKLNLMSIITGLLVLFNVFLCYFVNRLLYTMCTKIL